MKNPRPARFALRLFDNLDLSLVRPLGPSRVSEAQAREGVATMAVLDVLIVLVYNHGPLEREELTVSDTTASGREP